MTLQFLGVGNGDASLSVGHSNLLIGPDIDNEDVLAVDWGTLAPYIFRDELGFDFHKVDALYISHLHADHIGGLELFAFNRYFKPKRDANGVRIRPKLIMAQQLYKELWTSLKGGLESVQGSIMALTDYFDCVPAAKGSFIWNNYKFTIFPTTHIVSGYIIRNSFGLMIKGPKKMTMFTTDTQFAPDLLRAHYNEADTIFHDCETADFPSGVHAHYNDLITLPEKIKRKMWLYHYSKELESYITDGFQGFARKGQRFAI